MARDYANIFTAIWRDPAFRALHASQQRTYFMLITQPDISAAGTLDLTIKRWAGLADDTDRSSIEADLKALEAADFVYADDDTEELLVRTFVKHDKGYNNPKRRPVILEAARAVESARLREVLGEELAKLGLPRDLSDSVPPSPPDRPSDSHPDTQSDGLSHAISDRASASERVVVTQVGTTPQPSTPATADRSASPRTAASAPPPPGAELSITQRSKAITDAYAKAEPMCKWPAVNAVVIRALKAGRFTDDEVRDALLRMAAENRSVTVDSLRTELAGLPPRRASPPRDDRPAAEYHKRYVPED